MDDTKKSLRSSLIAASIITILFVVAGGKINNAGVLGGSFDFARPEILELTGVMIYLYLFMRFGIAFRSDWLSLKNDVIVVLLTSRRYQNFIRSVNDIPFPDEFHKAFTGQWDCKVRKDYFYSERRGHVGSASSPIIPRPAGFLSRRVVNCQIPPGTLESLSTNLEHQKQELPNVVTIPFKQWALMQWHIISAYFICIRHSNNFYNIAVPMVLACAAYLALSYKFFSSMSVYL